MLRAMATGVFLSVLAGCGTTGATGTVEPGPSTLAQALKLQTGSNGRDCVRISSIRGYGYRDRVLRLDAGRYYYLATTLMSCMAMDTAAAAAFDGPGGEICGGGSSRVSSAGQECIISHVFAFDGRKAAFSALDSAQALLSSARDSSSENTASAQKSFPGEGASSTVRSASSESADPAEGSNPAEGSSSSSGELL